MRVSRPVLGERRGAIPLRHSTTSGLTAGSAKVIAHGVGNWWADQATTNLPSTSSRMATRADFPLRRAVPVTDRYPAWIWGPHSDRKPLVTLRNTTEGRISRSDMLLVAGTSRLVRKTKNLHRQALICLSRTRPAGCATDICTRRVSRLSAYAA